MVRKLQKKFILIVALVLFLVLGGLVGAVNGINYWQTEQKTDVLLNMLLDNDGTFPENSPGNQGKQEHSPEKQSAGSRSAAAFGKQEVHLEQFPVFCRDSV